MVFACLAAAAAAAADMRVKSEQREDDRKHALNTVCLYCQTLNSRQSAVTGLKSLQNILNQHGLKCLNV